MTIGRVLEKKDLLTTFDVQFSHGWVTKFKKRFNIKAYTRHGEDAYVDTSAEVLRRMEEIKAIVSE